MTLGKILIVDDDSNLLELIKMRLESADYDVRATCEEDKAVAVFKAAPFDLCILDLMLANRDGISLMEEFRSIDPETPTIILTAPVVLKTPSRPCAEEPIAI